MLLIYLFINIDIYLIYYKFINYLIINCLFIWMYAICFIIKKRGPNSSKSLRFHWFQSSCWFYYAEVTGAKNTTANLDSDPDLHINCVYLSVWPHFNAKVDIVCVNSLGKSPITRSMTSNGKHAWKIFSTPTTNKSSLLPT